MTFYSPTISLDMWSLWPLMMEALNDWAIDFFESKSTSNVLLLTLLYAGNLILKHAHFLVFVCAGTK
jgi:hypothetical protein